MSDDKKTARQFVERDTRRAAQAMKASGLHAAAVGPDDDLSEYGNGDGSLVNFVIGHRGKLTKHEAREAAKFWKRCYPKVPQAMFLLVIPGYDDDPRELWEFPDVTRYVRWWARFAGLNDNDAALRVFGPGTPSFDAVPDHPAATLAFLAACGVFGEAERQIALRNHMPHKPQ